MNETDKPAETLHGPPTAVPTAFGTEITVPAGGTASASCRIDQDMILHGISVEAQGASIVQIQITENPDPGIPTVQVPGLTFEEYLQRELPVHLAAQVGEDLRTWSEKNQQLLKAAFEGDDDAFFELLARDPRQLSSDLTLRRVLTWRTEIDSYNRFYRVKGNRFLASEAAVSEGRRRMEQAQANLRRLGESQLQLSDQRGKRPLPPAGLVRGIYYGLLCLLQGLRALYAEWTEAGISARQAEARLSRLVSGLGVYWTAEGSLLPYVAIGARLITDAAVLEQAGFPQATVSDLVGPRWATPSALARTLTAAAFEVSETTIERLCAERVAIPLPSSSANEFCFYAGTPNDVFVDFPQIKELLATLTP